MPLTGAYWGIIGLLLLLPRPPAPVYFPDLKQISEIAPKLKPEMDDPGDSLLREQYPFLALDANAIINDLHLAAFFHKLDQLERGEIQRVNIVHIGDSHIQADWWTGQVRLRLQERFGSGGRGLVFPYQLADTNSPTDIRSGSNLSWENRKTTFQRTHIPVGISGLSIQTSGSRIWLDLQLRQDTLLNYAFDKVTLFGQSGPDCVNWEIGDFEPGKAMAVAAPPKVYHTVRNGDTLYGLALRYGTRVTRIQQWNNLRGAMIRPGQKLVVGNGYSSSANYDAQPFVVRHSIGWEREIEAATDTSLLLDQPTHRLLLRGKRTSGATGKARIFGVCLENSREKGLLYHAIGVNGVTFYHYNQSPEFWQQLPALQPDLVLVSLGANETANSGFSATDYSLEVDRFIAQLRERLAETPVVLTTPSDALRRARYENPDIALARGVILTAAAANDLAVWDLFTLMGGPGAIREWKAQQLAARDYLHFTKAGYTLQGELLFRALMKAYEQY